MPEHDKSPHPERSHAAIGWSAQVVDGPMFGWDRAKVQCGRCQGFIGTECPVDGCEVRLVSIQAEVDEKHRERMRAKAEERRTRLAVLKAEREARSR